MPGIRQTGYYFSVIFRMRGTTRRIEPMPLSRELRVKFGSVVSIRGMRPLAVQQVNWIDVAP